MFKTVLNNENNVNDMKSNAVKLLHPYNEKIGGDTLLISNKGLCVFAVSFFDNIKCRLFAAFCKFTHENFFLLRLKFYLCENNDTYSV